MSEETTSPAAPDLTTRPSRSPWVAALLSLLVPGLGQWYAGRPWRTAAWVAIALLLLPGTFAILIYLPIERANVALAGGAWVVYYLAVTFDAWRVSRAHGGQPLAVWQRWWACVIVAVALLTIGEAHAILVRAFMFETFVIVSAAMADTFIPGDRVAVDKLWHDPQSLRHDEVVVHILDGPDSGRAINRVIGLPGDVIESRDEVLYRNGEVLDEPYATFAPEASVGADPRMATFGPITVPEGEVFLMGDNRRHSHDSRLRGTWPLADIIAPVRVIYWSRPPLDGPHGLSQQGAVGDSDASVRWQRVGRRIR